MGNKNLFLVGCVHVDPEGPYLLQKLLDELNPSDITVEVSPTAEPGNIYNLLLPELLYLIITDPILRKRISRNHLTFIADFLETRGYELTISAKYQEEGKGVLHKVDLPKTRSTNGEIILRKNMQLPEILSEFNDAVTNMLKYLLNLEISSDIEVLTPIAYAIVFSLLNEEIRKEIIRKIYEYEIHQYIHPNNFSRDIYMAKNIREVYENGKGRVVHVGGLIHIYGEYNNLYNYLSDLNPTRLKLIDVQTLNL